jgi:hypothetical protein
MRAGDGIETVRICQPLADKAGSKNRGQKAATDGNAVKLSEKS